MAARRGPKPEPVKGRWVKPPGCAAAYYTEAEIAEVLSIMAGPALVAFRETGVVTDELRQLYREAVTVHEWKAAFTSRDSGAELLTDDDG
jgi:hypothetical protein